MVHEFIVVEEDKVQIMVHLVDRWNIQVGFLNVILALHGLKMGQDFVKDAEAKIGRPACKNV